MALGRHLGFQRVIFDCDSTLVSVEGIDELARLKGRTGQIAELTRRAMNGEVPLEYVYARRLEMLQPTRAELMQVGRIYRHALVPEAAEVVAALQFVGIEVFILSGGLKAAVRGLAACLKIPASNVFAVEVELDPFQGRWWDYQRHRFAGNPDERYLAFAPTPLAESDGKITMVRTLSEGRRAMMVGDGATDLATREAVKLFVGFGGVTRRPVVAGEAEVFVEGPGLAAVLPLALSRSGGAKLRGSPHASVFRAGRAAILENKVSFKRSDFRKWVLQAHADAVASEPLFGK
jgi:phosphoserine phosphatase